VIFLGGTIGQIRHVVYLQTTRKWKKLNTGYIYNGFSVASIRNQNWRA